MFFTMGIVSACHQLEVRPEERSLVSLGQDADHLTLAVTPISPGEDAQFRVVGPPSTTVMVARGTGLGTTCIPAGAGVCWDIAAARSMFQTTTDASGVSDVVTVPMSGGISGTIAFQARIGGATNQSNVVERTVVASVQEPTQTNILLLVIDDAGADRFGLYGDADAAVTPHIDGLAQEGVLFQNAWAMPQCAQTRASLQTGRYPRRTGFGALFGPSTEVELDPDLVTLAELVDHSPWFDYSSSYIGKWHLSAYNSTSNYDSAIRQGWDWWAGALGQVDDWDTNEVPVGATPPSYSHWQKATFDTAAGRTVVDLSADYATTDNVTDAIDRIDCAFLDTGDGDTNSDDSCMTEPWLMQVSFNAAHGPFRTPPDTHTFTYQDTGLTFDDEEHRMMLETVDHEIGRLLAYVDTSDTMIIVLGDNGTPEPVLDPEDTDPPEAEEAKGTVFDGGIRIPFIVAGAHVNDCEPTADDVCVAQQLVSVVDVFPTIAALAGVNTSDLRGAIDPAEEVVLDGYSLMPVLTNGASTGRTTLYAEMFFPGGGGPFDSHDSAIRDANYKLVVTKCGEPKFYRYDAARDDEGDDTGVVDADEELAYDQLLDEANRLRNATYDAASTWPAGTGADCPN